MARGRSTSLTIRLTPAERLTLLAWQRATTISAGRARRGSDYLTHSRWEVDFRRGRHGRDQPALWSTSGCSGFWRMGSRD